MFILEIPQPNTEKSVPKNKFSILNSPYSI